MKNTILSYCWLVLFVGMAGTADAQKVRTTKWESGLLDRRTKVGVWEYYGITPSKEKVVVQRYDHSTKQLIYFRPNGEMRYRTQTSSGQWAHRLVDRPPLFIGGDAALAVYTTQLQYPQLAQERRIQGPVTIGFVVDTLGHATSHRVLRSIGSGCDQEALRVARTIPDEWIPAQIGPAAVAAEYELTLTFRLAQP